MTIPTILGVLGILATVVFGVWGLYIVIRRRYPGEITLVVDDAIGLFDTIVKNFPDLAVLYQGKPVSHGLVLFKGALLNTGKKDVTPEMVESEIALELPDGFHWLAAKPIASGSSVTAAILVEPPRLRFQSGLFRCQEYIKFEALAEIPIPADGKSIEDKLMSELKTTHRIADTGRIRQVMLPPEDFAKRRLTKRIIMPSAMLFMGVILFCVMFIKGLPGELHFTVPQEDGTVAEVKARPTAEGTLHIKGKNPDIDEHLDAVEFLARADITPKVVRDPQTSAILGMSVLLYLLAPFGLLCWALRDRSKWKRMRKQIGLE